MRSEIWQSSFVKFTFSDPTPKREVFEASNSQVKSIQKIRLRQLQVDIFALNLMIAAFVSTMILWFPNLVILLINYEMWVFVEPPDSKIDLNFQWIDNNNDDSNLDRLYNNFHSSR